jgi:cellulose biosynthesis protein BcsQ
MHGRPKDDILSICNHAGLTRGQYKTFRPRDNTHIGLYGTRFELPEDTQPAPSVLRHDVESGSSDSEEPSTRMGFRWRAFRTALGEVSAATPSNTVLSSPDLPRGSLSLFSCGGGAGVTTLVATLGRALSLRGERVLLVDGGPESLLPYYFGGEVEMAGLCSFMPPRGSGEGSISVLARGPDSQDTDARFWRSVRASTATSDRLLVEAWNCMSPESRAFLTASTLCIAILVPDLLSLVRLRRLEKTFNELPNSGDRKIFVLLSRFDETVSLHCEVRQALARHLGDRLLPFTIRHSEQPALAVAEGVTVIDHAPRSGIADDFRCLADWVQGRPSLPQQIAAVQSV